VINKRLSTKEAADRLGVKPATLYSYVSRGLLHPVRSPAGSTYDVDEVLRLSRSARRPAGQLPSRRQEREASLYGPLFVTELTLIEQGRLYYRGIDAVQLAAERRFEEVANFLWTGTWPEGRQTWSLPPALAAAVARVAVEVPTSVPPVERFGPALMAAALSDGLRHDLTRAGVPLTGRSILAAMAAALPRWSGSIPPAGERMAARIWKGLTAKAPTMAGLRAMEAALVLAADHELAPSTLAARVAASFRADPYAVVMTALGPAGGSWQSGSTGAPTEVEGLLHEAAAVGPERAVGDRLRRMGEVPHGFGMPLYPHGDPRASALLERLDGVGPQRKVDLVRRVVAVGAARGFAPPNVDLALAALSYCGGMVPGAAQAIFTLAKAAGWLAHAMEEYEAPTRFRIRADYVGSRPDVIPAS
jgi:citrate synthase